MNIADILKLDKKESSIALIKSFLSNCPEGYDQKEALFHLINILHDLKKYEELVNELTKNIHIFLNDEKYQTILKFLFNSYIELQNYDRAYEIIEERKKVDNNENTLYDEIIFNIKINKPYKDLISFAILNTKNLDYISFYYKELINIYINENNFNKAKIILDEYYSISSDKLPFEELFLIEKLGNSNLRETSEKYYNNKITKLVGGIFLLKYYIKINNYQKSSTIESDIENLVNNSNELKLKKIFYEDCLSLYEKMKNKMSITHYGELLDKVNKEILKLDKQNSKKVISINKTNTPIYKSNESNKNKEIIEIEDEEIIDNKNDFKETLDYINKFMIFDSEMSSKLKFRDYLRTLFIYVESLVKLNYIFIYNTPKKMVYYYKKERLYDKPVIENYFENTFCEKALLHRKNTINYIDEKNNLVNPYSKEKDLLLTKVYTFYLGDNGLISINVDNDDKNRYFYQILSSFILTKLQAINKFDRLFSENRFLKNIIESNISPIMITYNSNYSCNELATKYFEIEKFGFYEIFSSNIHQKYYNIHKEKINKLLRQPNLSDSLLYRYKNKMILENMVSILDNDTIKVISLFIDKTNEIVNERDLQTTANTDLQTSFYNENYLKKTFNEYINTKFSLLMFKLNINNESFYNENDINKYYIEFSNFLKNYFLNAIFFRIQRNLFIVKIENNDIRKVTSLIDNFYLKIKNYQVYSIKFETFKPLCGIVRYPIVTENKNISKIIQYLFVSLSICKQNNLDYYLFQKEDYKQEIQEQEIIKYINTSIDNNIFELYIKQVTDINKNQVFNNETFFRIPNFNLDYKDLIMIAKKRNKLIDLEKLLINKTIKFTKEILLQTSKLIKFTIPISYETFINKDFSNYLFKTLKDYGINPKYIRLKLEFNVYKDNFINLKINELLQNNISLDTINLKLFFKYSFENLYYKYENGIKENNYIKFLNEYVKNYNSNLIISNVNNKEALENIKKLGVTFVSGKIYKEISKNELFNKIKS